MAPDLRFKAFNALNHPQFGTPGTVQGSSNIGQVTNTNSDNRGLQFVARYVFWPPAGCSADPSEPRGRRCEDRLMLPGANAPVVESSAGNSGMHGRG